jgi:hypothetical protein
MTASPFCCTGLQVFSACPKNTSIFRRSYRFSASTPPIPLPGNEKEKQMSEQAVEVTGIHLLRLGDHVVVNAEIDGKWVEVIREWHDSNFSHIVGPGGMRRAADGPRP